ncbi:MAG: hypothetical protein PF694_09080 [Bacteroidetes bacterium]|jgi:transcriptional regulator with XRE-family HTH domain|nr:hypothetical protein [Bacteroidota bacterium]
MYIYGLSQLKNKHRTKIEELAKILGVSKAGWYWKMTRGTFTEEDFKKLSEHYEVPVSYFKYEGITEENEPKNKPTTKQSELDKVKYENQLLRELIDKKDKELERLNREIGKLESKVDKKE